MGFGTHQDGDPGGQLLPFGFGTLEALGGLLVSAVGDSADQGTDPPQGAGSTGSAGGTGSTGTAGSSGSTGSTGLLLRDLCCCPTCCFGLLI